MNLFSLPLFSFYDKYDKYDKYCKSDIACSKGHCYIVEILLRHGANIHDATTHEGDTPLHLACSDGQTEIVRFLLDVRTLILIFFISPSRVLVI